MNYLLTHLFSDIGQKIDASKVGVPVVKDPNSVVIGILNAVYFAAGMAAIIVIIIAGIFYSLSAGDPGRVKQAKEAILYAVVGLVVVMMAFAITGFVAGRF